MSSSGQYDKTCVFVIYSTVEDTLMGGETSAYDIVWVVKSDLLLIRYVYCSPGVPVMSRLGIIVSPASIDTPLDAMYTTRGLVHLVQPMFQ